MIFRYGLLCLSAISFDYFYNQSSILCRREPWITFKINDTTFTSTPTVPLSMLSLKEITNEMFTSAVFGTINSLLGIVSANIIKEQVLNHKFDLKRGFIVFFCSFVFCNAINGIYQNFNRTYECYKLTVK